MNEIKTGVLRSIVKDQLEIGQDAITVPDLLRRLQLDASIERARTALHEALAQLESEEVWEAFRQLKSDAELRRLVGGITFAEIELSALVVDDF